MRRCFIALTLAFVVMAAPAFAELELGVGIAPPIGNVPAGASTGDFFTDATKVVHAGYSFLWIFYAGYDGFILPPYAVSSLTSTSSGDSVTPGYYRPGFLNTFNVGIRPSFGPVNIMASIGINNLYIYKQGTDKLTVPSLGVNLKVGAGLKIANWLGITATGTSVFSSFNELTSTLKALVGKDAFLQQWAQDRILSTLFPSVALVLYL